MFGINNSKIDYLQLAVAAAGFIRKNMSNIAICLITNEESIKHQEAKGCWKIEDYFTDVRWIPGSFTELFENSREFRDTRYYSVKSNFRNESRFLAYELSPFDETLLIDSDYLVCSDSLSPIWGCQADIAISNKAIDLENRTLTGPDFRLNQFGIRMYWGTVIYFKKSEAARMLFSLVDHVRENWEFYRATYEFTGGLYRNDFALSIAIHILNGFIETDDYFKPLPDSPLLSALDSDQLYKINGPDDLSFFVNNRNENWKFHYCRLKGINVHCMNKISIINNMTKIMETLGA